MRCCMCRQPASMPSSQAAAVIDVGRVESFTLPSKPRLNLVYIKTNTSSYLLRC